MDEFHLVPFPFQLAAGFCRELHGDYLRHYFVQDDKILACDRIVVLAVGG